jgi:AbrB family looped-hinge helix DNA binding protein
MPIAQSKLTAQGQISVPSEVRKRLGIAPGSVLEWDEQGDQIVVRRAGRYGYWQKRYGYSKPFTLAIPRPLRKPWIFYLSTVI